jgi:hypothetical protein
MVEVSAPPIPLWQMDALPLILPLLRRADMPTNALLQPGNQIILDLYPGNPQGFHQLLSNSNTDIPAKLSSNSLIDQITQL